MEFLKKQKKRIGLCSRNEPILIFGTSEYGHWSSYLKEANFWVPTNTPTNYVRLIAKSQQNCVKNEDP